jgi:eukaryotic-like serine/threonine-protein kinase
MIDVSRYILAGVPTGGSAAQNTLPSSGDVLAGKYRIVRVVGEGGMGIVYEARHARLGHRVAIKVLREKERQIDEFVQRFEREARAAARLKSPNTMRVHDVDQLSDGTPFMVMEYLEGVDLDTELGGRGRLPVEEAVGYVLQACSAVAEAHSFGIVHRDLKPHNLFLTGDDTVRHVKLLDFGISKIRDEGETSVTLTRSSLGTPLYMSPEQIRSARNADARADIWSLGVILYELLTGKPPFDGEGPSGVIASITADPPVPPIELRPGLPKTISDAVIKALEKNPANRFQTVADLAETLVPYGPPGAWIPPASGASNPSNPRISLSDIPRVSAEAITEPAPHLLAAEYISSSETKVHGSKRPLVIALLAVLVSVATAVFFLTRPAEPEPSPPVVAAPPALAPPEPAPVTAPPLSEPEVAPELVTSGPAVEASGEPSVPAPRAAPKSKLTTKSAAPKPEKKEEPAPPPPPPPPPRPEPENPLHL